MQRWLIWLLFLGCASPPEVRDETLREATWLAVATPHTTVRTNLPAATAEKLTRALECDRQALSHWTGVSGAPRTFGVDAIILARRSELAHFADSHLGGLHAHRMGSSLLVLAADGDRLLGREELPEELRRHELAHALLYGAIARQPRWLAEGLAAYLETMAVDAHGQVTFGKVNPNALTILLRDRGRIGFERVRAWRGFGLGQGETSRYYASAWAWVHFLHNERREAFTRYLQHLADGMSDDAAWSEAFNEPDLALERALSGYLKAGYFAEQTVKLPACEGEVQIAPLPPAGIHTTLAQLLLSSPKQAGREARRARAREELTRALELDPEASVPRRLLLSLDSGAPHAP